MNKILSSKLEENNLIYDNTIVLDEIQSVDIETFSIFFGDSLIYKELIGIHTFILNGETFTKTGEELGYKPFFDKWKELKIV